MKPSFLRTNCGLLVTLAALLFSPALAHAATVITSLPYVISAPGQYELQNDLTANGTTAIAVLAANVVINLNEHTLTQGRAGGAPGVDISASNVIVRNGAISGFLFGVRINSAQDEAENLRLLNNTAVGVLVFSGGNHVIQNCYVIGNKENTGINVSADATAVLVRNNQVFDCGFAIRSATNSKGSAFIHNYVANSGSGLQLGKSDFYQGNVATNCVTPFSGGNAIGQENGGS